MTTSRYHRVIIEKKTPLEDNACKTRERARRVLTTRK